MKGYIRQARDVGDKVIAAHLGIEPPQATDLEEALLGAALTERQAQIIALEILTPEDFYIEANAVIFKAMATLAENGHGIDIRTVVDQLRKTGEIELVGGAYYVAEITSKVSSAANMEYYARVISQKRILRDLILESSEISRKAYEPDADPFELLDRLSAFPLQLLDKIKSGTEKHIKQGVVARAESINKRTADQPDVTGVPSGYSRIDRLTMGWQKTDLIIVAARPSMGKTTLVLNLARNASIDFNIPVGIFSMEMSFQQLCDKLISGESDIETKKLLGQKFSPVDWDRFLHTTKKLSESPIYIDDTAALSISDLRVRCRRMVEKYGVKMIIIDYIQLMKGEHHTRKNREQEISSISRGLKQIAKELNIPVIALSQLSRDVEKRQLPKLPILADLRESGSLEQDADIVIFLWRPEYYKIQADPNGTYAQGLTKVIFAKHRNGEPGEAYLSMIGKTSRFKSIDSPYMQYAKPDANGGGVITRTDTPPSSDETPF